ncbi:MAG: hypothetical protein ACRYGP_06270 [Janthinobacterium lividum]
MSDQPTHLFAVGERVSLSMATIGRSEGSDVFIVKARMPHVGTQLQYRVKAENEPYERVVTEGQLTRFGSRD